MRLNVSLVAFMLYLLKAQLVISAGRNQKLLCMPVTNLRYDVCASHPLALAVEERSILQLTGKYEDNHD